MDLGDVECLYRLKGKCANANIGAGTCMAIYESSLVTANITSKNMLEYRILYVKLFVDRPDYRAFIPSPRRFFPRPARRPSKDS
jgi:hypothetical protein